MQGLRPHSPRKVAFTLAEVFLPYYLLPRRIAFTLAEVLITLGIIGVVAAMTLPTLIQNYKERSRVVALQKAFSILSQAYQRIVLEDGTPDVWLSEDGTTTSKKNAQIVAEKFKPYLKVIKDCGFETGCFKDGYVKTLNGLDYNNYNQNTNEYKLILADGTALIFYGVGVEHFTNGLFANIKVDVDGLNGENTFGKDVFLFEIGKKGLYPCGDERLNNDYDRTFEGNCINKSVSRDSAGGISCTAWVIYNGNMDYLHCPEKLGWDKAKRCK